MSDSGNVMQSYFALLPEDTRVLSVIVLHVRTVVSQFECLY